MAADEGKGELDEVRKTLLGLYTSTIRSEARTLYRAGTLLNEVIRSPDRYGKSAVEQLAKSLGQKTGRLYEQARVGRAWTAPEIEALLERRNRYGFSLSWSHLVALSEVAAEDERRAMVDQAIEAAWSVRELRQQIDDTTANASNDTEGSVGIALREFIQTADRTLADFRTFDASLDERVRDDPKGADGELVTRAINAVMRMRSEADRMLSRLVTVPTQKGRAPERHEVGQKLVRVQPSEALERFVHATQDTAEEPEDDDAGASKRRKLRQR